MAGELELKSNIALKEWAVVCDEVLGGRQVVLLRKGGILEQKKGFQIEHERFFFYPNTEHQSREQLKAAFHPRLDSYGPPARVSGKIAIVGFGRVVDIVTGPLPAGAEPCDVLVVVAENEARVEIPRGENAGRTLDHIAIARQQVLAGLVNASGETRLQARIGSSKRPSSVVAIVSERLRRKVWGVGVVPMM